MNAQPIFGSRSTSAGRIALAATCGLAGWTLVGCATGVSTANTEAPAAPTAVASNAATPAADPMEKVQVGDGIAARLQRAKSALGGFAAGRGASAELTTTDPFRDHPHFRLEAQQPAAEVAQTQPVQGGVVQTSGTMSQQSTAATATPLPEWSSPLATSEVRTAATAQPAAQPATDRQVSAAAAVPAWVREPNPFDRHTVEKFAVDCPATSHDSHVRAVACEGGAGAVSTANSHRADAVNPFAAAEHAEREAQLRTAQYQPEPWAASGRVQQVNDGPLPPGSPLGQANPFGGPTGFGPAAPATRSPGGANPAPRSGWSAGAAQQGTAAGPAMGAGAHTAAQPATAAQPTATSRTALGDPNPLGVRTYLVNRPNNAPSTALANSPSPLDQKMIVDLKTLPERGSARYSELPADLSSGYPITPRQSFGAPAWLGGDNTPAVATANQPTSLSPHDYAISRVEVASVAQPARRVESMPSTAAGTDAWPKLPPVPPVAADSDPFASFETLPAAPAGGPRLAPVGEQNLAAVSGSPLGPAPTTQTPNVAGEFRDSQAAAPDAPIRRTRLQDYSGDGVAQPITVAAAVETTSAAKPWYLRIGSRPIIAVSVVLSMIAAVWMRRRFV